MNDLELRVKLNVYAIIKSKQTNNNGQADNLHTADLILKIPLLKEVTDRFGHLCNNHDTKIQLLC